MEIYTQDFLKKQGKFYKIVNSVKRVLADDRVPEIKRLRLQFVKGQQLFHEMEDSSKHLSPKQTLFNDDLIENMLAMQRWVIVCERHNAAYVELDRLVWLRCREFALINEAKKSLKDYVKDFSLMFNVDDGDGDDKMKDLIAEIKVYENNCQKLKAESISWYNKCNDARVDLRRLFAV